MIFDEKTTKVLKIVGYILIGIIIVSFVGYQLILTLEDRGWEQFTSAKGIKGVRLGIVVTAFVAIGALIVGLGLKLKANMEYKSLLNKYKADKKN